MACAAQVVFQQIVDGFRYLASRRVVCVGNQRIATNAALPLRPVVFMLNPTGGARVEGNGFVTATSMTRGLVLDVQP